MSELSRKLEVPSGWVASLERSKAQIAEGLAVPLEPILERLSADADALEAKHSEGVRDPGKLPPA